MFKVLYINTFNQQHFDGLKSIYPNLLAYVMADGPELPKEVPQDVQLRLGGAENFLRRTTPFEMFEMAFISEKKEFRAIEVLPFLKDNTRLFLI